MVSWKSNLNNLIRIKQDSHFKGSYTGLGDLELNGNFEGTLKVKNLHVKKSGVFVGFVTAHSIVVEGDINDLDRTWQKVQNQPNGIMKENYRTFYNWFINRICYDSTNIGSFLKLR